MLRQQFQCVFLQCYVSFHYLAPEPTPEPLEPAPPTKVEEEVVATMIMQEEAGPVDLAAALKEFEEKAGPAEVGVRQLWH